MKTRSRILPLAILLLGGLVHSADAGGGPENVFLVVNSADPDSMAIANFFIDLRKVPVGSVFYVNWADPPFDAPVELFRDRVLRPTLEEIKKRRLTQQIDYIVYSSGFPYAINFTTDLGERVMSDNRSPAVGSITGLTYLYRFTMNKDVRYLRKNSNAYARNVVEGSDGTSAGFRARYGIDLLGERVESGNKGQHYYLSMMLGHTGGKANNTLPEITRYLMNGVRGDGTNPKGTIYFVSNSDIRSTVRDSHFPSVVNELKELGVNAETSKGERNQRDVLPVGKKDVMGVTIGHANFAWGLSESVFLPGAIAENFTSYGGRMAGTGQTLLSNFLKFGAVASSGTVCEPLAHHYKFPHPRLHVHYARGCSVAESFYQSVLSPYQLLIVGDPLCQPWATPPTVKLRGLNTRKTQSGEIEFEVDANSETGKQIRNLEIFVDGQLVKRLLPNKPVRLDTSQLANGYHELRVVAIEDTAIETQGRFITGFVCVNEAADSPGNIRLSAKLHPDDGVMRLGRPSYVRVRSQGASEIRLYRGRDVVGRLVGEAGRIMIDAAKVGGGPVWLRAVAFPKDKSLKPVFSFPVKVNIQITQ